MFTRKEKFILFILAFIQFSHIVDFMIMMPLEPKLVRIFSINPQQFSTLVSSYTFTAGVSGILSSLFMDRFDRKNALLFFFSGFIISTLMCAFAPSYHILLAARVSTGAFGGVLSSLTLAITGDLISPNKRGQAIGVVMSGFSVASILGVPFSLKLADIFDWHAPFIFLGLISVVVWILIWFSLPPVREHLSHQRNENVFARILQLVSTPGPRLALIFMLVLTMGQFLLIPFISPSLVANAGMPESQLFLVYLIGGSFSLVASPFAGKLADKYGKHKIFLYGAFASILPIVLISNLGVTPVPVILFIIAMFFSTVTFRFVPAMAMITGSVTVSHRGSFMSIVSSAQNFAAAIGASIAGLIISKEASGHLLYYNYSGLLAVATALLAIYLSRKLKVID